MANKHLPKTLGTTKTSAEKQSYTRPVFQVYGKLKQLTQSSGSANGDGGAAMMAYAKMIGHGP